ncbi:hypothetical protein ACO0LB_04210 [Undibacterium sp. SXout7W]|uniref:hypothetical protein n=1 Tax=Undibacterium sp. SXout7W TaxID=3413049 RepID=UPI003BF0C397
MMNEAKLILNELQDFIRTLLRIRKPRELPPPGPKPAFGSTIVLNNLKIQLFVSIDYEQWEWLTHKGWRTMDQRINRRRYYKVPRKAVQRLLHASTEEREQLHQQILDYRYSRKHHA